MCPGQGRSPNVCFDDPLGFMLQSAEFALSALGLGDRLRDAQIAALQPLDTNSPFVRDV